MDLFNLIVEWTKDDVIIPFLQARLILGGVLAGVISVLIKRSKSTLDDEIWSEIKQKFGYDE